MPVDLTDPKYSLENIRRLQRLFIDSNKDLKELIEAQAELYKIGVDCLGGSNINDVLKGQTVLRFLHSYGDKDAPFALYKCYKKLEPSSYPNAKDQALQWLYIAVNNSNPEALYMVACAYLTGDPNSILIEPMKSFLNTGIAIEYLSRSAAQHHCGALLLMSIVHGCGEIISIPGITPNITTHKRCTDLKQAEMCLKEYMELQESYISTCMDSSGETDSKVMIDKMYEFPVNDYLPEYHKINNRNGFVYYLLGVLLNHGFVWEKDCETAEICFKHAANLGYGYFVGYQQPLGLLSSRTTYASKMDNMPHMLRKFALYNNVYPKQVAQSSQGTIGNPLPADNEVTGTTQDTVNPEMARIKNN